MDAEYWGLTMAPVQARDSTALRRLGDDDAKEAGLLARVTRVRSGRTGEARFTLDRRAQVHIYAVGEGSGGEMYDYAIIEDSTGRDVWTMRYEDTEAAGGAAKNRRVEHALTLEPGAYTLRFRTDGSHGWGDWNSAPPDDPLAWGAALWREGR
jgi:hypothetical protein